MHRIVLPYVKIMWSRVLEGFFSRQKIEYMSLYET